MLTKRQNLLETIRGGNPDRLVNQFEALGMIMGDPVQPRPDLCPGPAVKRKMPGE